MTEGEEQDAVNAQVHAATEALLEGHFVVAVKRHRCAKKIMSAKKVEDDSELKQLDKDMHEEATKLLLKKVKKMIALSYQVHIMQWRMCADDSLYLKACRKFANALISQKLEHGFDQWKSQVDHGADLRGNDVDDPRGDSQAEDGGSTAAPPEPRMRAGSSVAGIFGASSSTASEVQQSPPSVPAVAKETASAVAEHRSPCITTRNRGWGS